MNGKYPGNEEEHEETFIHWIRSFTENEVRRFVLPTDAEIIQSWRIGNNGTFLYVIHH